MSNLGIGTDEWVAQHEERLASQSPLKKLIARIPLWAKWGSFFLIAFLFGMFSDNQYFTFFGAIRTALANLRNRSLYNYFDRDTWIPYFTPVTATFW